jgi:predicted peptidase
VYPYAVYLPPGYPDGRRWPAVLVLHGAGSRGTDGLRPRTQSVVEAARLYPARYPAILVLPQCPPGTRWLGAPARAAWRALEHTLSRYAVDPTRVYLAGQSMGADGGFELAARHADRLAAFVAVALGWGEPDFDPAALRALPVRVFHGTEDRIPVARARARVARLRAAGHRDAVLREYPGRGHEIFDEVYRDSTVSGWLFRQRRAAP